MSTMNKELASMIDVAVATNDQVFLATAINQEDFDAYWASLPYQDERDTFTYAVNAAWAYMYGENPEEESCVCEQLQRVYPFIKALDSEPVGLYHVTWDTTPAYQDPSSWYLVNPAEIPF